MLVKAKAFDANDDGKQSSQLRQENLLRVTVERLFSGWLGREQLGSDGHQGKARRMMKMMTKKTIHPVQERDYSTVG